MISVIDRSEDTDFSPPVRFLQPILIRWLFRFRVLGSGGRGAVRAAGEAGLGKRSRLLTLVMRRCSTYQCNRLTLWRRGKSMEVEVQRRGDQLGGVRHSSMRVWCTGRAERAVISVIERADTSPAVRFVLWCSLRGAGECDEHCVARSRCRRNRG